MTNSTTATRGQLALDLRGRGVSSTRPTRLARKYKLIEGETVSGTIVRLPMPGVANGSRLFIQTTTGQPAEYVAIPAAGRVGWSVLARRLSGAKPGDRISVTFKGWRVTRDGRRYRDIDHVWGDRG